jgi:uncharacterized protein YraI
MDANYVANTCDVAYFGGGGGAAYQYVGIKMRVSIVTYSTLQKYVTKN